MIVAQKSTRPAHRKFYTVAGRLLCLEALEQWSLSLFERFFAGFYFNLRADDLQRNPDATIRIHAVEALPETPPDIESFEIASGGVCLHGLDSYYLLESNSLAHVTHATTPLVEVWIKRHVEHEPAALARLVFNTAMAALRRCQLFELHGGAVVEPESGAGVLIIGPSGSGKSTLTTQLAASGWGYLSDDSLLLYGTSAHVEACALRRVFSVTEKTIAAGMSARLENITTAPVPFDPEKRRFVPQDAFPDGARESCRPRVLCFPIITHESSSRARKLSQSEAMTLLLKMSPWACYDKRSAREHLGLLSSLTKQAVSFELLSGENLLGDPELTSQMFSSIVSDQGS